MLPIVELVCLIVNARIMKLPFLEFPKKKFVKKLQFRVFTNFEGEKHFNNFGLSIEIAIGDFPKKNNENSQGNKIKNKKGIFNNSG